MTDPHAGQPVLRRGPSPADARVAAILVHGRGGSAADMINLAEELDVSDVAYLAPSAAGHTWYPYSFLAPIEQNEPGLSSGLKVLTGLLEALAQQQMPPERVMILGFSQGACLSLEFAARHAQRYAGVVGLSGGLIGPPGVRRTYSGTFENTPIFLGCSDIDPHIPLERVHESADVFCQLRGDVDERIYTRMEHTINRDELDAVRRLLSPAVRSTPL